jgi:hypothetical protein
MTQFALRASLVVRSLVCIFFSWTFWETHVTSAPDLAQLFATFVLADGALALIIAGLLLVAGWHKAIVGIAAMDGLMCLAAYVALHFGPGIPYFAVTLVLYTGLLAAFGFSFGVLDIFEASRLRRGSGAPGLRAILVAAGLGAIVLAITQFFMNPTIPNYEHILTAGAALQALTMLALAFTTAKEWARPTPTA